MIKILELFGGIGACSKALEKLGIEYEIVDYVDIDKYACKSFNAIHKTNFEVQDITNWYKHFDNIDLIMHGSPCQDFSVAGKNQGGDEGSGTRSSLLYETIRIVEDIKPKYVIWENVKNVISKKHKHNFDNYIERLNEIGYTSYYQVLNAKNYGIPQNRERVFTISIRNDISKVFSFPEKQELKLKLKDFLDDEVDKKYYLSQEMINGMLHIKFNSYKLEKRLQDIDSYVDTLTTATGARCPHCVLVKDTENYIEWKQEGKLDVDCRAFKEEKISGTIVTTNKNKVLIKNNTKKGYLEASDGDGVYTNISNKRGTVQKQMIQTLTSFNDKGVVLEDLSIRRLTPLETWRLMGFDDEDFDKASKVCSDTQLYKQAGNSIVVNVLMAILNNLIKGKDNND